MKITPDDYARLDTLIQDVLKQNPGAWNVYQSKGLSPMRFRWDLYHKVTDSAQRSGRVEDYRFMRRLYDYLNDDNLDTALRSITKDVTL